MAGLYTELSKKRGNRVRACRKAAGIKEWKLADMCGFKSGEKYISRIETGYNLLSQKAAEKIGAALHTPVDYLMCRTDSKYPTSFNDDSALTEDSLFLKYLLLRNYELQANIVLVYEKNQPQKTVPVHALSGFDFCNSHCVYDNGDGRQEVIITDMAINGFQMPFHVFCFAMTTIYRYIDFTINSIPDLVEDFIAHSGRRETDTYTINTSFPANNSSPQAALFNLQQMGLAPELFPDGTIRIDNEATPANKVEPPKK